MAKRVEGGVTTTQNFNVENELSSVVSGGNTTSFTYDAAGMRIKNVEPGQEYLLHLPRLRGRSGGQHNDAAHHLQVAGQAVALRVHVVSGSNTLTYLHSDHPSTSSGQV